jgi:hypothetical protein
VKRGGVATTLSAGLGGSPKENAGVGGVGWTWFDSPPKRDGGAACSLSLPTADATGVSETEDVGVEEKLVLYATALLGESPEPKRANGGRSGAEVFGSEDGGAAN